MMGLMTDNKNSHQFQRQDMMGLMTDNKISHQLLEKLQHQHQSLLFHQSPQIAPAPTNRILTAGGVQSAVTDDVPSCSTSPSTNNCPNAVQLPATTSTANIMMDLPLKSDFRPQGLFGQNTYSNVGGGGLMDHMETSSSSATSASFSQNDTNTLLQSFNQQPVVFRGHENMDDGRLGLPLISEALAGEEMVDSVKNFNFFDMPGFENYRDPQQELPSSMAAASQSYCAPEMSFHSVDSTLNDEGFMNMGVWPPQAPKLPRMRTFTKVYKRGAVGRSIDMSRYSGYDELKQDLARRFGIEGQLEDPHRSGWKLVYLDHENDILLVGDDPWEEFVSCVRCIKILSPQEVEQMSLDGDLGQQNQGCSSSEAGNV